MKARNRLDHFRRAMVDLFVGAVEWKDVDPEMAISLAQAVVTDARVLLLEEDREAVLEEEFYHPLYTALHKISDEATLRRREK